MPRCKYCGKPLIRINPTHNNDKEALFICENPNCSAGIAKSRAKNTILKRKKRRSLVVK